MKRRGKKIPNIIMIHVFLLVVFSLILHGMNLYLEFVLSEEKPLFIDLTPDIGAIILILLIGIYIFIKVREASQTIYSLTITDELTGLFNLRKLEDDWNFFFEHYKRYGEPFCLAFIDIDNFKKYNDTLGHEEGDHLLTYLGRLFHEDLRKTDRSYRYGGDEFVLVLTNTNTEGARVVAQRIVFHFTQREFQLVGLSMGIAQIKEDDTFSGLITRADNLMYEAKKENLHIKIEETE